MKLSDATKPLTRDEEAVLLRELAEAKSEHTRKRIRDRFILSVSGYAAIEARRCKSNAPFDDLFQAGMAGATKAFDKFDPAQGVRFSTYALHWIRAEMWALSGSERSILSGTALRGRDDPRMSAKSARVVPIDYYDPPPEFGPGHDADTLRIVPDQLRAPERCDDDEIEAGQERAELGRLLETADLTPNERWVIEQRWLGGVPRFDPTAPRRKQAALRGAQSLRDLAQQRGLSRERVRQIEANALRKLRRAAGRSE